MREADPGGLLILGIPGPSLAGPERRVLEAVRPAGVILFGHNVAAVGQVRELVAEIRAAVPGVLLFVDAEGGRVDRFRDLFGRAPAASSLAAARPRQAERAGRWIGRSLGCLGLDVDLAPVLDLDHGAAESSLADRALGSSPRAVIARGRAFLRGLETAGVGGCVKHFPGLGRARQDTHHRPAVVEASRRELERDLRPFRKLAPAAGMTMVSHAVYPAFDPEERPATLSPAIVRGLLRNELGFAGLVVTDDLDMKALDPWGDVEDRVLRGLEAGIDAFAICHSWARAPDVVTRLRRDGEPASIRESLGRWERYRRRSHAIRGAARTHGTETIRGRLAMLREAVGEIELAEDPTAYRS